MIRVESAAGVEFFTECEHCDGSEACDACDGTGRGRLIPSDLVDAIHEADVVSDRFNDLAVTLADREFDAMTARELRALSKQIAKLRGTLDGLAAVVRARNDGRAA